MSEARKVPNASDANSGMVIMRSNPRERTFSSRIRTARTPVAALRRSCKQRNGGGIHFIARGQPLRHHSGSGTIFGPDGRTLRYRTDRAAARSASHSELPRTAFPKPSCFRGGVAHSVAELGSGVVLLCSALRPGDGGPAPLPRMTGKPSLPLPTITTFEFVDVVRLIHSKEPGLHGAGATVT